MQFDVAENQQKEVAVQWVCTKNNTCIFSYYFQIICNFLVEVPGQSQKELKLSPQKENTL